MERDIKLIWDFRGFDGAKTARHHEIHLKEFINKNELTHFHVTGTEDINEMHSIAFWVVPESEIMNYRDILKPHRAQVYLEQ
ncbi:MAG TPA: hypothetical protein VLN46_01575 [Gillisia sp.]|nr:hypothetical protein [Gillisia sp.]